MDKLQILDSTLTAIQHTKNEQYQYNMYECLQGEIDKGELVIPKFLGLVINYIDYYLNEYEYLILDDNRIAYKLTNSSDSLILSCIAHAFNFKLTGTNKDYILEI